MKDNEYQCAVCNEIFQKGWTDEESIKEKELLWGDISLSECAVICDDCFRMLIDRMKN